MKNVILIITTIIMGVIVLMTVMTINGRMNRSMELKSNLSSIVEETLEDMTINHQYGFSNTNEIAIDLAKALSMRIDSTSDIKIDILQCNKDRGILAVKATLYYTHPNGKPGTVSCEKIAILDKSTEMEIRKCRVTFYVGDEVYKEYMVAEGTILPPPQTPILTDGTFLGWVKSDGSAVDIQTAIHADVVYFASIGK